MRWSCALGLSVAMSGAAHATVPAFQFQMVDRPGGINYGQTSLVDIDKDGDLDFVSGRQGGAVFWFENRGAGAWARHALGDMAITDVGGVAFDVDRDGWIDEVSGGTFFRNTGNPRGAAFERIVTGAISTHDNLVGDVDGDGRVDLVSLKDDRGLFWYTIPGDPRTAWPGHQVVGVTSPPTHGGLGMGDIDGDGDADITRVDRWFENLDGTGLKWREHRNIDFGTVGPWGLQTRVRLVDLDGDRDLDLIQSEGDVDDGRVAWFENLDGKGGAWARHLLRDRGRKEDFHAMVVADFDKDGDLDVLASGGPLTSGARRTYVWENLDGKGGAWKETPIYEGVEGHETVAGDIDRDGDVDVCSKPWAGDTHYCLINQLITSAPAPAVDAGRVDAAATPDAGATVDRPPADATPPDAAPVREPTATPAARRDAGVAAPDEAPAAAAPGDPPAPTRSPGGCSVGNPSRRPSWFVVLAALGVLLVRRRRPGPVAPDRRPTA
jgi:MYXO-CTERM domain-containing protein